MKEWRTSFISDHACIVSEQGQCNAEKLRCVINTTKFRAFVCDQVRHTLNALGRCSWACNTHTAPSPCKQPCFTTSGESGGLNVLRWCALYLRCMCRARTQTCEVTRMHSLDRRGREEVEEGQSGSISREGLGIDFTLVVDVMFD